MHTGISYTLILYPVQMYLLSRRVMPYNMAEGSLLEGTCDLDDYEPETYCVCAESDSWCDVAGDVERCSILEGTYVLTQSHGSYTLDTSMVHFDWFSKMQRACK